MAIGDAFAVYLGTAESTRQPSSGVFEQISCLVKGGVADDIELTDGSNVLDIIDDSNQTAANRAATAAASSQTYNMSLLIGNAVYIHKAGTTDRVGLSGVQVDA